MIKLTTNKQVFNLDKLHIQFKYTEDFHVEFNRYNSTKQIRLVRNFDIEKTIKSIYSEFFHIHYNGNLIGEIHTKSKTNNKIFKIEFKKELVYSSLNMLLRFYNDFMVENNFSFDGFCSLELSLNELCDSKFQKLWEIVPYTTDVIQCYEPKYEIMAKSKPVVHCLQNFNEFIITSRNAKRKSNNIVIYRKTDLEPYQVDFYRANGLNVINHLYRTEARLFGLFFTNLKAKGKGYEFKDIINVEKMKQLFDYAITDKLDFKDLLNPYYDSNRNRKYPIISLYEGKANLDSLPDLILNEVPATPQLSPLNQIKRLYKDLITEISYNPTEAKKQAITELITTYEFDYQYEAQKVYNKGINPDSVFQFVPTKNKSFVTPNLYN
jgi:hypothetical protein